MAVGVLVLAQRQADDVDVVLLHGALHGGPQPQPMSSSVMPGLRSSLSRLQVDLGDLRLFQRDVGALEVRAAVRSRRVLEQPEEVVGEVVVRLDVFEVRRHSFVPVDCQTCVSLLCLPTVVRPYRMSRPDYCKHAPEASHPSVYGGPLTPRPPEPYLASVNWLTSM